MMPEYWDLYDKNREKIGKTHLRGEPLEDGMYHIVMNVWIINSKNEILLTRRHPDKVLWGGMWECAAGGSILAGEDSLQGALRETKEEIGIDLPSSEAILIHTITRSNDIRDTFLFKADLSINDLTLAPKEVVAAKWVARREYDLMCGEEVIAPPVRDFFQICPLQILM